MFWNIVEKLRINQYKLKNTMIQLTKEEKITILIIKGYFNRYEKEDLLKNYFADKVYGLPIRFVETTHLMKRIRRLYYKLNPQDFTLEHIESIECSYFRYNKNISLFEYVLNEYISKLRFQTIIEKDVVVLDLKLKYSEIKEFLVYLKSL